MPSCDMLESLQGGGVVTTVHIPILGYDPEFNESLNLPMTVETLELPVETVYPDNTGIQTVQVGGNVPLNSNGINSTIQPMIIASTDSQGNCFVTLQDEQAFNTRNLWNAKKNAAKTSNKTTSNGTNGFVRSATVAPGVPKVFNNRYSIGTKSFTRCGRSRMIADHLTSIPVSEFKSQLNDTSDTIGKLDLAPSTKRQMNLLHWKGIGKLFAFPGRKIMSDKLVNIFTRHLRTKLLPCEETFSDMKLLPVGYKPEVDPSKIKRITRRRRYPEADEYRRKMIQEEMERTVQSLVCGNQPLMQTIYLTNSETLKHEPEEEMHVLIQSSENSTFYDNEASEVVDVFGSNQISDSSVIVINNNQEENQNCDYAHQNIEVLLAAAGENEMDGDNVHQVVICNSDNGIESVLPCASSIIIVPNNLLSGTLTETVVTS